MDRYDKDRQLLALARSMVGARIQDTRITEKGSTAVVEIALGDGRTVTIGVTGSLHDEAYLVFDER